MGSTYSIAEQSLLDIIMTKLNGLKEHGLIAKEQHAMRDAVKNILLRPERVPGLKRTDTPRSFYYDPTITLNEDLRSAKGKIIHQAGTKLNPADFIPFKKTLIFLDADDTAQVDWFKTWSANTRENYKVVLVGGPILTVMKDWQQQVYFDQEGRLTQRLGIKQVPAIVRQHEKMLHIIEVIP